MPLLIICNAVLYRFRGVRKADSEQSVIVGSLFKISLDCVAEGSCASVFFCGCHSRKYFQSVKIQ